MALTHQSAVLSYFAAEAYNHAEIIAVYSENYTKYTRANTHSENKIECSRASFSGILSNVYWWLVTDVSGQPVGPIFKGQAGRDGNDRLSRNVSDYDYPRREMVSYTPWRKPEIKQTCF